MICGDVASRAGAAFCSVFAGWAEDEGSGGEIITLGEGGTPQFTLHNVLEDGE